ncbi:MAG: cofactor-independent phosphoglycerate mutase [Proteobacteria bacterium]|nr:cofactor-independent phosphoglycerate mutase [Pseudomonadota bacterium]MBU1715909.1 cofactor-independent phosphoglycerate mutase [Pseudomonadota bacterium]
MKGRKKTVILVGDGMGDLPIAALGGRTPLEAAKTPAMDYVSIHGELSLLQTIPEGFSPGSDVANLSLLGYRPQDIYTGRAPLEAASMGVELGADEIAFRCNLVTLQDTGDSCKVMVDYSAGHITSDEARILIEELHRQLGGSAVNFHPGVSYRHLCVHQGDVSGLVTVPPHDHTGDDIAVYWQAYLNSSLGKVVAEASRILVSHPVNERRIAAGKNPANAIWLWGEGRAPVMATLQERYGISGSLISAVDLLKGIGVYAGMRIINVPGATGYLDTNYQGKVDAAFEALKDTDLVFVHVEAPDEAAHQGEMDSKLQAIEDFDRKIVQPVLDGLMAGKDEFRLIVAMDHFTPLATRTHDSRPVPVALFDSLHNPAGSGLTYSEKNGAQTGLIIANGQLFFERILSV